MLASVTKMDFRQVVLPRKKRHFAFLAIILSTALFIGLYLARYEVTCLPSTTSSLSLSRKLFRDHRLGVVHALDHGCYLQTSNFTHHHHSSRLLAKRKCEQKLPVALIAGGALCGTVTFKSALSFHPDVVLPEHELSFFYESGHNIDKNQYLSMMPYSLPTQISVDESQEYMYSPNVSKASVNALGPDVKIIILVRDPVARAVSEYLVLTSHNQKSYYRKSLSYRTYRTHVTINKTEKTNQLQVRHTEDGFEVKTKSKRHVRRQYHKDKDKRKRRKTRTKRKKHHRKKRSVVVDDHESRNIKGSPSNSIKSDEIRDNLNDTFETTVLGAHRQINAANFLIQRSVYVTGMKRWKYLIPRDHMLVLDAEAFARNPADSMTIVEKFLGLKPFFRQDFFDFDLPNGVLCFNSPIRSCLEPISVQRPLPVLSESLVSQLRDFFVPWMKIQNRLSGKYFPHLGENPLIFTPFR